MSKAKDRLVEILRERVGDMADPAAVVEVLYRHGVMDDVLARQAAIREEYVRDYSETNDSARQVMVDIGDRWGMTREGVLYVLRR